MSDVYGKLMKCLACVQEKVNFTPQVALVLGSGLGDYADGIEVTAELAYNEIDGFPVSTVPGHEGKYIFGYVDKVPVVCMKGRVHYYEGYDISDVVLPVRLMCLMGAKVLFLTNASGGVNTSYHAGDFMLIKDHIANFVPSPLIGPNIDALGVRFPDMSNIYDRELQKVIRRTAALLEIPLQEGVYIQLTGPNYESPSEVRMCRTLGADAVGMSTACEAVAAKHMGMRIAGLSFISNPAAGISKTPLSHKEVQERADAAAPKIQKLITATIQKIGDMI